MTQATEVLIPPRASETRLVASVCFAHLVSHYNIVLLAPLFVFIRADYGVSYTELGFALTAFNIVSTVFQTPMGFLVDRMSARLLPGKASWPKVVLQPLRTGGRCWV